MKPVEQRLHVGDAPSDVVLEQPEISPEWPDPLPLPNALPPVKLFDFDLLPDSLRPWIQDIAERVQCPPDFPAVGAMISLSAVVGRKIGIRPKRRDDWLEVPNLWGTIIGRPGVMKSPALREAMRPLRKLEVAALETFDVENSEWRRENELFKLKREAERSKIVKALKKGEAVGSDALADEFTDHEPQPRRYVVNDCSVEALGEILRFNPNGVLAYRDELIGLLKSLDKEGNEGARGFFLSAWSGTEGYTFDRIGRGLNLRIDACCLSLLGSIQPAVIGTYLRQAVAGAGDDGLLSRFQLLVWPDIAGEWQDIDRWPDTEAKASAHQTFERLDTLDPLAIGATVEDSVIPYLRFDEAAQELFSEWRASFEHRIRNGNDHAAFESHLAKYRKLVPALALLIHLADHAGGVIGETALLKALAWAEYLESHARRAYASVTQAEAESARILLTRIRRGEVPDPFRPRDVYLKHWAYLANPEEAHQAVRLLTDLDYLREERQETGGRPKTLYWINPKTRQA
jgi:putative DNA primase/helicase